MSIRKRNGKYEVTSENGKQILGRHNSRKKAVEQLQAVEASKSKRKKK